MLLPKGIRTDRAFCVHCGGKGWLPTPESLRAERVKAGLSLTAVAKEMGIAKSRLSSLETGRWDWNADLVNNFRTAVAKLKQAIRLA